MQHADHPFKAGLCIDVAQMGPHGRHRRVQDFNHVLGPQPLRNQMTDTHLCTGQVIGIVAVQNTFGYTQSPRSPEFWRVDVWT
jgi:hypothetical protein